MNENQSGSEPTSSSTGGTTGTPPPPGPPTPSPPGASRPGPAWVQGDAGERIVQRVRRLRRSRNERVVAGVCGGVARELGLDPLLLRVVIAVLTFFGGAGLVLYAAGWLLLPVDDGEPSLGAQVVDRDKARRSTQGVVLAVVLAVVVTIGLFGVFDHWDAPVLLALVAVGFVVYVLRSEGSGSQIPVPQPHPTEGSPSVSTQTAAAQGDPAPPYGAQPYGAQPYTAPTYTAPGYTTPGYGPVQDGPVQPPNPPGPTAPMTSPAPPKPPRPPREHSMLTGLTLSLLLIVLGTLAALEASGTDVAAGAYPAAALSVLGLGLLVGAWIGRARGVIWIGVILALVTMAFAATSPWVDRHGPDDRVDVSATPTSVADLPGPTDYGAGTVRYDLSDVPFDGQQASMNLQLGIGEIVVIVPENVDVTAHAEAGVGQVDLFQNGTGGFGTERTVTDLGPDGEGGGTLDLELSTGIGHVEVRRAQA